MGDSSSVLSPASGHPTAAAPPPPPPAPGPFKLKFKLGGGNASGSVASPSSPSHVISSVASSSSTASSPAAGGSSSAPSPAPAPAPVTASAAAVAASRAPANVKAAAAAASLAPGDKPKRKRAPKRPAGESGPGKAWRKGLKGTIVAGQVNTANLPPASDRVSLTASRSSPGAHASASPALAGGPSRATATASSGGTVAGGWYPTALPDARTPRPREWTKDVRQVRSISGGRIALRAWYGRPSSAYATARANAAAAEAATVAAAATSSTAATPTMFKLPQHSGTSTSAPLHLPPPASSSSKPATTSPLAFSAHKAEPGTESAMQVSGSALRESAATAENSVKVEVAPLPVAMAVDT